jgi:hypothetical protein
MIGAHEAPGQGATNDWLTPQWVLDALGPFDLDPCASEAHPLRCAPRSFTWRDNGLVEPWGDAFVFCNPPYGPHVGKWLAKMVDHQHGIALVFARTDTTAMQAALKACDAVLFVAGRLHFVRPHDLEEARGNSGAPSMLLAFGAEAVRRLGASGIAGAFFEAYGR